VLLQLVASFCYPIAKYGLNIIEPFTFAFYRFILASVSLLVATVFVSKKRRVERSDYPRLVLLGILIIPINQTLFLVGQSLTGAGHGAFLFATTPIWIFALALVHLKEPFIRRRAVGLGVAAGPIVAVLARYPWWSRTPFGIGFWSFSFPLAALASSVIEVVRRGGWPPLVGGVALAIASLVIAFLAVRTIALLVRGRLLGAPMAPLSFATEPLSSRQDSP